MLKKFIKYSLIVLITAPFVLIFSCNKDEEETPPPPAPTTGIVEGIVTDGNSASALENVRIVLFNANTNEPTNKVVVTDTNGHYSYTVAGGNYYLKLSKQEYSDVPARGISGLAFTVTNGGTLTNDVDMYANNLTNIGWISGQLTSTTDGDVSGCLVVAVAGFEGYSTISDSAGYYSIFNVPSESYLVKGWKAGINSTEEIAFVFDNFESAEVDLSISDITGHTVSGTITFLATSNIEVDVALTHPDTEESIPGLGSFTSSSNYSISNVPNAVYLARATYVNDGVVMDPDWIVKNGEPFVNVEGASTTRDFSVTGAVGVVSPSNPASSTTPVASPAVPTFTWESYASTSDYVIEVSDANGIVIWGGFSDNWTVKNIVIPSSESSIEYNSNGNASSSLEVGNVYRWRIYASKNSSQSPTGWELISVSEDQRGLIIIE